MHPALGLIEGYCGTSWSHKSRVETIAFLAPHGFRFYTYAPKADPYLRGRWREDHPSPAALALHDLADACRMLGVRFGVGLRLLEIDRDLDRGTRAALARKLSFFSDLGVEDLAIIFDDVRGDVSNLAQQQVDILHWIAERSSASRLAVRPTYCSDDPILDRAFGQRPEHYLDEFGARLDPSIDVFWTGEEVYARAFSTGHLDRVCRQIGRKVFLWDNYPANDGPLMSQYLHLRGFTGRPATIANSIAGHAINPALQPVLTRIPALTLTQSYRQGETYAYAGAFMPAATLVLGADLAAAIREDVSLLQDVGLDRLGGVAQKLRARYQMFDHPAAREILAWLDGAYRLGAALVPA